MNLEKIRRGILAGKSMEEVIEKFDWREFESFVAEIFVKNGFFVRQNFRFKTKERYEIDIVAVKGEKALCVDCKEWSAGRYKKAGLKHAAAEQEERMKEFVKFLKKNPIAQRAFKVKSFDFRPLIVTLLEEDLVEESNTYVVPVWKLNSFLVNIEKYL